MKKKCFSLVLAVSMVMSVLSAIPAFAAGPYTPASDLTALEATFVTEELTNKYYALPNHENLLDGIMPKDKSNLVYLNGDSSKNCYIKEDFPYVKLGYKGETAHPAFLNKNNVTGATSGLDWIFSYSSNPEEIPESKPNAMVNFGSGKTPVYFAFDLAQADEKTQTGSGAPKYFNRVSIAGKEDNATNSSKTMEIDGWKLNITDDAANFQNTAGSNTTDIVNPESGKWKNIYTNGENDTISGKAGTVKLGGIVHSRYLMVEIDNIKLLKGSGNYNFRFSGFQVYLEDVVAKQGSGYTLNAKAKTVALEGNPAIADFLSNLELQDANLQAGVFTDSAATTAKTGNVANGNYLITYFETNGTKEIVSVYTISAGEEEEPTPTPTETATPTPTETTTPTPTATPTPVESNSQAFTPDSTGMPGTTFLQEELTNQYYALPGYKNLLYNIVEPDITMGKLYSGSSGSGVSLPASVPYVKMGANDGNEANIFNASSAGNFPKTFNYSSDPETVNAASAQSNYGKSRNPIYFAFDLAHEDEKKAAGTGTPQYFNRVSIAGNASNTSGRITTIDNWKLNITNTPEYFVGETAENPGSNTKENMAKWKTVYENDKDAGEVISGTAGTVKMESIVSSRYLMVEVDNIAITGDSSSTVNFRWTGFQVYLEDVVSNDSSYVVDARAKLLRLTDGSNLPAVTDFLSKFTLQDAKLHAGVFSDAAGQTEKQASAQITPGQDYLITYFGEGADKEIVSVYDINFPVPRVENVVINAAEGTDVGDEVSLTYTFHDCDAAAGHTDQSIIQWYADGALIGGATEAKYTLRTEDMGKNITAKVIPSCGVFQGKSVESAAPSANVKRIVVGNLMPGASVTETENCATEAITSMLGGFAVDTGTVNASANTIRFRAKLGDSRWVTSLNITMTESDKITGYEIIGYLNGEEVAVDSSAASGGGVVSKQLETPRCIDEIEVKVQSAGDGTQKLGVDRFEIFSNLTDALAVSLDKQNLTIQDANVVVSDLMLPSMGAAYTSIRWASSDESIVTSDGKVKVPFTKQPHDVTMTAVITRGNESDTVQIPLKVYGIDQFEMPPKDGPGENLTAFSIITGEGELKPGSTAAMAADGKGTTGWIAKVSEDEKPSLTVDFGMEREVNRLRAAETLNGIDYAIAGYTVSTSSDGTAWETLFSGTETGEIMDKSFDTVTCRYVKFTITALQDGAVYGGIRELELYFEPSANDIVRMEEEEVTLNLPYMISTAQVELPQPKYGAAFHWITENGFIADDGTVTHPKDDTKVTLSLQISREGIMVTKSFGQFLITGTEKKTVGSLGGGGGSSNRGSSNTSGMGILGNAPQVAAPQQPAETAAGFEDVSKSHWASGYIADLSIKGILSGVSQNRFAPEEAVTREQIAKLLVCAFDVPAASGTNPFTDVPADDWSADYICRAAENGLLRGIEDGIFGLGSNMSRQDVAVAIVRALEQNGIHLENGSAEVFVDADAIDEYAKSAVAKLYKASVMVGDDRGNFRPGAEITRAEAAKIICVAIRLASGSGEE